MYGSYFWFFVFFLSHHKICKVASFISKLLTPPPLLLLPPHQWQFCNEAVHADNTISFLLAENVAGTAFWGIEHPISCSPTCSQESSTHFLASCSWKLRVSTCPVAASCNCLTFSSSCCLQKSTRANHKQLLTFQKVMPGLWDTSDKG